MTIKAVIFLTFVAVVVLFYVFICSKQQMMFTFLGCTLVKIDVYRFVGCKLNTFKVDVYSLRMCYMFALWIINIFVQGRK